MSFWVLTFFVDPYNCSLVPRPEPRTCWHMECVWWFLGWFLSGLCCKDPRSSCFNDNFGIVYDTEKSEKTNLILYDLNSIATIFSLFPYWELLSWSFLEYSNYPIGFNSTVCTSRLIKSVRKFKNSLFNQLTHMLNILIFRECVK